MDADALFKRAFDKKLLSSVRKTRAEKLSEAGVTICPIPDDAQSTPGGTVSVPAPTRTAAADIGKLMRAKSSAVPLPLLEILPADILTSEPSTAPSYREAMPRTAPWSTDGENYDRCGPLRQCNPASLESQKKWFVLRRGLEPFYPSQLEVFNTAVRDRDDASSAIPIAVLTLEKATGVTLHDGSSCSDVLDATTFQLTGRWCASMLAAAGIAAPTEPEAECKELGNSTLTLDAGTVDNKHRWVEAIARVAGPNQAVSGRRRSLSWQGTVSGAVSVESTPPPPPSPVTAISPLAVAERHETDSACDDRYSPHRSRSTTKSLELWTKPLQLDHRVKTKGDPVIIRATTPKSANRRASSGTFPGPVKEGEVLVLVSAKQPAVTSFFGGGAKWEPRWLRLNGGVEPWYGPELQLLAHAPKASQPPPKLLAAVPMDACEFPDALNEEANEKSGGPKHGIRLQSIDFSQVRGSAVDLLRPNDDGWAILDAKNAAGKASWEEALSQVAATAQPEEDTACSGSDLEVEPLHTVAWDLACAQQADVEGYMDMFLLSTVRKVWTKRWVVLHSSAAKLLLYTEEPDRSSSSTALKGSCKPNGEMDLSTCVGLQVRETEEKAESVGLIETVSGSHGRKLWRELELRCADGKLHRMRCERGRGLDAVCQQWLIGISRTVLGGGGATAAPPDAWDAVDAVAVL